MVLVPCVLVGVFWSFASTVSGQSIDVLITGQNIRSTSPYLDTYRDACAKEGLNVNFILQPPAVDYTAFPLELMKKFHVIVFHGEPGVMPSCKGTPEQAAAFRDRLEAFRRLGGGILWMPTAQMSFPREWNETIGARYGARVLPEDLYDPGKVVDVNPGMHKPIYRYIWTTDITPHPVTDGVKGLFLPAVGEWSWPGTVPVEFGPDWKVLVRAMDTTRTIGNAAAETVSQFKPDIKGSIASAPAIVGVREDKTGGGRMMVFPLYSAHTYQNFGHFVFNEALMKNGADGHPSDGHRLLLNAYRWLAAPAQAAGLGGYRAEKREVPLANLSRLDWSTVKKFQAASLTGSSDETKQFRGLIGVKSGYGGGMGSVSEYAAEAKRLGLSFLVFLDDADKLSPDGYQKLVKDCASVSDESFLAIPGYSVVDTLGNSLFLINPKNTPGPGFVKGGRLLNYWGLMMQEVAAGFGMRRINAMTVDPYFYFWITCVSPFTWEKDKLVDDGFERYRTLQGLGEAFAGVAVAEVSRPADLKSAALTAHQTVVSANTLARVGECLTKREMPNLYPIYITNGPRIDRWAVRQGEGDAYRPGGERFRLELNVSGDSALKEVTIVNCQTGQPYRTFRPKGTRSFSCTIDESHSTEWFFIPLVTDENGHTAVGSMLRTTQLSNHLTTMSDRLMGMHHSSILDGDRKRLVTTGGWLGGVTWVKRSNGAGGYPLAGDARTMRIFGFDGGNVYSGAVDFLPRVGTCDGEEPHFPGYRYHNRLASFDMAVVDFDGQLQFEKAYSNECPTAGMPVPVRNAEITSREWAVRPRAGTQTASNVHEITARFKQATTFTRFSVCTLRRWDKSKPCHWFIRDAAGEVDKLLVSGSSFSRRGTLRPGDYLYPANEIGGPVGIINLGPTELQYTADETGAKVFIDGKSESVKAGSVVTARLVCFSRDRTVQNDAAWLQAYVSGFGIGAAKPGYGLIVKQGVLTSTNYAVDLAAVDGGAGIDMKKFDLPHNVPVRVSGLAANAVACRYDLDRKQLLILPVFEGMAPTTVNTTTGDTRIYVGELFHCDDSAVVLSTVQDGEDKLLVEIHNPTDKPRKVELTAVPGFAPLNGLKQTVQVAPFSSEKVTLATSSKSLNNQPYQGD